MIILPRGQLIFTIDKGINFAFGWVVHSRIRALPCIPVYPCEGLPVPARIVEGAVQTPNEIFIIRPDRVW